MSSMHHPIIFISVQLQGACGNQPMVESTWNPIFDDQPSLAIGAIKINQQNPSEIWVGTGEGNPRNSQNSGKGIFRTLDGGRTWKHMGLTETKVIHRILIDYHTPSTIYVGAGGSPWGPSPDRGVFKSTDSGKTWTKILFSNEKSGIGDMVMDPAQSAQDCCCIIRTYADAVGFCEWRGGIRFIPHV